MSNDNSVYRNDNDALRSRVVALTEENEELLSEIERLQALVESENKAIVFCPVDDEDEDFQENLNRKFNFGIHLAYITQFIIFIFGAAILEPKYYFLVSVAGMCASFITVILFLYRERN
jgi:hypothetical protein